MTGQSKALMWAGIGLCVAGAVGLIVGAILDVDAADPWASVAGGAAALIGLALPLYAYFGQPRAAAPSRRSVQASGDRSVAAGGSIGSVSTGNGVSAPPPPTLPAPTSLPPSGNVTASGDRSVAAGGDVGSVSTGNA